MPLKMWRGVGPAISLPMLCCISHYYTRLLRFVIKDILEMPTSTLNKYAKLKVMQNKLVENVKDGNAMIFFCHYWVPLAYGRKFFIAEFETPRTWQVYPVRLLSSNFTVPWKCQYLLCWRSMFRCVHSGTLSPKLENNQPNFLRSKYYVKMLILNHSWARKGYPP